MSKGTIIYYGGFSLPDKSASANRVVSNGKIFDSLGYETVFIGASDDSFDGLRPVDRNVNMFEYAHPKSTKQWLNHMLSVEYIESVAGKYKNVCKIILYNVPLFTLLKAKKVFSKKNIEICCIAINPCTRLNNWYNAKKYNMQKYPIKQFFPINI